MYINDITHTSDLLKFILFADDTTILYSHANIDTLISKINHELTHLCDWFSANKLSLNVSKTNYMLFNNNNTRLNTNLQLKINGEIIDKVESTKFLGLHIDDKLNWKQHIDYVQNKLSKTASIMYRMRYILNENTLRTLYTSLYLPYINYCSEVWGNTYKTYMNKIITSAKS